MTTAAAGIAVMLQLVCTVISRQHAAVAAAAAISTAAAAAAAAATAAAVHVHNCHIVHLCN